MKLKGFLKNNAFINGIYFVLVKRKARQITSRQSEWEQVQKDKLAALLNYAKKHSKYYWMHIGEQNVTPEIAVAVLKTLPLLTKDIIRDQQFNIYSDETGPKWKVWGNTGGSTGEPLKFPRLSNGQWNEPVCQYLTFDYLGGANCGDIIVSVSGVRVPEERLKKNKFYVEQGNFPWGKYNFSTLYMTEENLPYYVEALNNSNASFMRGYSAGILSLAQYIKSNNIPLKIKLKGIYMTSEAFAEQSRKYISEVFNCPVIGQYGHTEMSVYAYQHKEDSEYECMPLYGYTEILDEKGKDVKEGETGEIIVTGFNQIGMPFIRYKTGDLATYKGTKNGIVHIDAIQGRTVDFLYDREGCKVFLTGAIFGGHIKAFTHIAQWQLVQDVIGVVEAAIIKGDGYDETVEKDVKEFFEGFNIEAKLHYVSYIEKQKNGKQKFLIQKCVDQGRQSVPINHTPIMKKAKPKVLFIVPLPPPVHGSTVVAQSIKDSKLINDTYACDYINLTTSRSTAEIGRFNLMKVVRITGAYIQILVKLMTKHYDLCYAAISFHGGLLKDAPFVLLCKLFRKKVVIHLHGKGASKDAEKGFYRWLLQKTFKNTKVIMLSWHLYPDVAQFVKKEDVTIIPNGIPAVKGISHKSKVNEIPNLLFLSNLIESKGVIVLLDALKLLTDKGLQFHCNFVGGESTDIDAARFATEVEKRNIVGVATYLGKKFGAEKEECFNQSDIFVFPTFYNNECFPLVLLEAMAHKLPCITTDEGGILDIVNDGVNGLICKKNNADSLADCIEQLLTNSELREQMGEKGYKIMQEKFTEEVFEKNMCDTLKDALGGVDLS